MGLLDKIKDLFLEEAEEDEDFELEDENKNIYEEPKDILPKVMRETIKREEFLDLDELKPSKKKEEVKKVEEDTKKFNFPFDLDDVAPSRVANKNVLNEIDRENEIEKVREVPKRDVIRKEEKVAREEVKKAVELYPKKEVVREKPKFRPTPVISPVYGILDKNYRKEEVREKSDEDREMKRPSKSVDFETVRRKAFGNLTDEIKDNLLCENCELYKEVKRISKISSDGLLYDMMVDDNKKEDESVTLEKAYDNYEDFGVTYEPKKEEVNIESATIINNNNADVVMAEEIEIKDKSIEKEVIEEEVKEKLENISFKDKIEEFKQSVELEKIEERQEIDEEFEKLPSREDSKKKSVDDDFFKLIDSMYKERIDE